MNTSFKQGDRVAFANRTQHTAAGMRIEEVSTDLFGTRVKVEGKWWSPGCFMSFEDWKKGIDAHAARLAH